VWLGRLRSLARAVLALPRAPRLFACLAWMGGICWLSSRRFQVPAGRESFWRVAANFVHVPLFGGLCLLFVAGFPARGTRPGRGTLAAAGLSTLLYAILDELHQRRVPGRHPAALDVLTDATAAACVIGLVLYARRGTARDGGLLLGVLASALLCLAAAALASFVGRA
jgi:hypothetical protein